MAKGETMDFDAALAAYDSPAVEVNPEPQQPPVQNLGPDPSNIPEIDTTPKGEENKTVDWRGNPDYVQSGPRMGMPKLRNRQRKLVEFETREDDSVLGGELITGAMFISMIDLLIPGLIVLINNMVVTDKKYILKMSDMQLEAETLAKLKPLAESTLRRIKLRGNPMVWLSITMLGMYGFRFASIQFERKLNEALESKKQDGEKQVH